MYHPVAYQRADHPKEKICPVCAHLHWDHEFVKVFATSTGDYDCSVCKAYVRVEPIWSGAPFKSNYWSGVLKRTIELLCVAGAFGIMALIIYLSYGG